jgi:CubicO group peptidase (beta-lactamase class C family)
MKKSLFIAFFLLLPLQIFSQITLQGKNIDTYIEESMKRWNIPGMSVAVIEDGKVTYMKGFGVRELGKTDKVDENTLFAIASNSKAFTGLSIAMLESEGKLNLNDKVSKYIPGIKMYDPNTTELLTIKDVMTHRVGLGTFQGDFITWGTNFTALELIDKLQYIKPAYDFRSGYGYFNTGYTIAGEIIKRITGKEWGEYVKENILTPLNMNRTLMSVSQLGGMNNVAIPHTYDYEYKMVPLPWRNVDNLAPAGGMISCVSDMAKWVTMQIGMGEFEGKTVFPKKLILNTHTPYNLIPSPSHGTGRLTNRHFNTYALGWGIGDYKNEIYIEHSGGYDGMISRTAFLPDRKFGLVILTNNDQNDAITTLMYQLFDYAMKKDVYNWDSLSFVNSTKDGISYDKIYWDDINGRKNSDMKPDFQMNDLQGTYFNVQAGNLVISKSGDEYTFKLSSRPETGGVFTQWRNDTLVCKFNDLVVGRCLAPVNAENGKIISIKIKAADFVDPLYYEFVRKE